jgi:hypothetical protein
MGKDKDVVLDPEDAQPPIEPTRSPVRFNAVKHGILSVSPVVPYFESEDDWYDFRDSVFESIQPEGGLQQALADRVATLLWRLMRVVRYEREVVSESMIMIGPDIKIADSYLGEPKMELTPELKARMDRMAMRRLVPDEQSLSKILRYEGRLHRYLLQTIHQLKLLKGISAPAQQSRRGVPNISPRWSPRSDRPQRE